MNLFSLKPQSFGLDISDFSLRYAFLEKGKNEFMLKGFGEREITPGIVERGEIKKEDALSQIIRDFFERQKEKGFSLPRFVIASLPEEKCFVDVLSLPLMEREEIKSAVSYELENIIPIPLENVYFDFEVSPPDPSHKQSLQEVVVAAVPKDIADSYFRVLKRARLEPLAFEVECFSIARAVIPQKNSFPSCLIVDMGKSRTTFIICSREGVRLTFSTFFSSHTLTVALKKKFRVSEKKAEDLKINQGLLGEQKVKQCLQEELDYLVQEIKNHIDYYYSHETKRLAQSSFEKIKYIVLCGGGANLKGLDDFIAQQVGLPTILANPWTNIFGQELKKLPPISFERSLSFATALGLALRGIYD